MVNAHSFHIPVMGIGYTVDTPAKVAQYGISSVVSLVDDLLVEKMREFYCKQFKLPFSAIGMEELDYRAKRFTAYLNVLNVVVQNKFEGVKNSTFEKGSELHKYLEMACEKSEIKQKFLELKDTAIPEKVAEIQQWIKEHLTVGSIDVNIMTKLDKINYKKGEQLPIEYNDAHAALRGFAQSSLDSSIVLSAGINQHLYSYMAEFDDFFPDENGYIKKKIILKVSDYRSALIQGKLLAKKGLWVSEFRVESGLNCGGHAFPTDGYLLGPILEEFCKNRNELSEQLNEVFKRALIKHGLPEFTKNFPVRITVQGGVGTAQEHNFLLSHYGADSIGWGSPFLLVPETTNVDAETIGLIKNAEETDYYLSGISPLGVPFNNLRNNSKDRQKEENIAMGTPGSLCPKDHLALNNEFGERALCTASRKYQTQKIKEISESEMSEIEKKQSIAHVCEKACICVGLGTAALINNDLDMKIEGSGVSICPGPALVSFDKTYTLKEMIEHIYGKIDLLAGVERLHFFVRELKMYADFLFKSVSKLKNDDEKQKNYLTDFRQNVLEGIEYYLSLFPTIGDLPEKIKAKSLEICGQVKAKIEALII
jgi:hypothetical protein